MAMTLTQLERYMVSEIDNLQAKLDAFIARMDTIIAGMEARLRYIEQMTDEHRSRLGVLVGAKK
jgi:chemotaxis regulatin CheY-phosphate phosphatase CheZ